MEGQRLGERAGPVVGGRQIDLRLLVDPLRIPGNVAPALSIESNGGTAVRAGRKHPMVLVHDSRRAERLPTIRGLRHHDIPHVAVERLSPGSPETSVLRQREHAIPSTVIFGANVVPPSREQAN